MSCTCQPNDQQLCGCCAGVQTETPEPITNRPALSAISYRIGRFATFYASMLAALSDSELPALAALRTRDSSDFSIAFLDTWAVVCDILTFYQERLANEAYLRCAIDNRSVIELAALVGYKPSPGVAASAMLAFSLNSAPGAPDNVTIPAGTRVQSVPGPGQTPQVFETSNAIVALIRQNRMAVKTTVPWGLNSGLTSIWIAGVSNNLNLGAALLFVNQAFHDQVTRGMAQTGAQADFHFVSSVQIDAQAQQTLVVWDQKLVWPTPTPAGATDFIYVLRKHAALFGAQSIDPRSLAVITGSNGLGKVPGWPTPAADSSSAVPATQDWTFTDSRVFTPPAINLDASYPGLAPSKDPGAEPQWIVLVNPKNGPAVFNVASADETSPNAFLITSKTTQLTLANGLTIPNSTSSSSTPAGSTYLTDVVGDTRNTTVYVQSSRLTPVASPYLPTPPLTFSGYATDPTLLQPVFAANLEVLDCQQLTSGQAIAINGNRLRMQINSPGSNPGPATFTPEGSANASSASNGQIFLVDAFPPTTDAGGDLLWQVITTAGIPGLLNSTNWNITLLPADARNDPVASEAAIISVAGASGVALTAHLTRAYDRSTVTVNANVAPATNGETTNEILGNGDATNSALEFTLKQSPLTYVPSALTSGSVSSLQVWVNNLRWSEEPNFLSSGPADRVFVTSVNSSGTVNVEFGDGVTGGRPPTGLMNIRAVYRKGIGSAGNVATGQLSLPLDRPQGLQTVTNPQPAAGGADPDTAADARNSAPLHVQTIGRVVSLEDYQIFALTFAGVSKALATWAWFGRTRGVLVTIAGAKGGIFQPTDLTVTNLTKALVANGSPNIPVQVVSYTPGLFEVGASIQIDTTDYDPTLVLVAAWQALANTWTFQNQQLGNGVAQSQIIQAIQQVPGVIALELTQFNLQSQLATSPLATFLSAATPLNGLHTSAAAPLLQGAGLLTIDPASQANLVPST